VLLWQEHNIDAKKYMRFADSQAGYAAARDEPRNLFEQI